MKTLTKNILQNGIGVEPMFNHQMSVTSSLNSLSEFLVDMGIKLRKQSTPSQVDKYNLLSQSYVNIRGALAQIFIHESTVHQLEQMLAQKNKEIAELKKQVDILTNTIEFQK